MSHIIQAPLKEITKSPRVSIGMPVYNGAKFIREALDSLLAQTFIDFELIISDNASTDGTEAICQKYADKDKRVRYVRQVENIGAVANFQFVLDEAVGEYFMWAAHDDRHSKEFVKFAVDVFSEDACVGLVFSDMVTLNLQNGITQYSSCGFNAANKKYKKYLFRLVNGCSSLIYGLHKREVLKRFRIDNYDFMDIHLTHWYELNSLIKTIPLPLYTAGTDGIRVPYSITGPKIDTGRFLNNEWQLLRRHFCLITSCVLFLCVYLLYGKIFHNIKE